MVQVFFRDVFALPSITCLQRTAELCSLMAAVLLSHIFYNGQRTVRCADSKRTDPFRNEPQLHLLYE